MFYAIFTQEIHSAPSVVETQIRKFSAKKDRDAFVTLDSRAEKISSKDAKKYHDAGRSFVVESGHYGCLVTK